MGISRLAEATCRGLLGSCTGSRRERAALSFRRRLGKTVLSTISSNLVRESPAEGTVVGKGSPEMGGVGCLGRFRLRALVTSLSVGRAMG